MTKKQSVFGRVSQLVKANINDVIDNAEDPEKMLAQMERDYKNSIVDAENSIAETSSRRSAPPATAARASSASTAMTSSRGVGSDIGGSLPHPAPRRGLPERSRSGLSRSGWSRSGRSRSGLSR